MNSNEYMKVNFFIQLRKKMVLSLGEKRDRTSACGFWNTRYRVEETGGRLHRLLALETGVASSVDP